MGREIFKRSVKVYPRKFYWELLMGLCAQNRKGKGTFLNELLMEKIDTLTPLQKEELYKLYKSLTPAQKKNPKLLPGEE